MSDHLCSESKCAEPATFTVTATWEKLAGEELTLCAQHAVGTLARHSVTIVKDEDRGSPGRVTGVVLRRI